MRPSFEIFMPFGQPSYSATSDQLLSGAILKMRPKGMSTIWRWPDASNAGPSIKQSAIWPGLLASAQSVRTPLRRKLSGIAENSSAWMSFGGVSRYIIARCHLVGSGGDTIGDNACGVDWGAPSRAAMVRDGAMRLLT